MGCRTGANRPPPQTSPSMQAGSPPRHRPLVQRIRWGNLARLAALLGAAALIALSLRGRGEQASNPPPVSGGPPPPPQTKAPPPARPTARPLRRARARP